MSRMMCVTPYNEKLGRHMWEFSVFRDSRNDKDTLWRKATDYVANLYVDGELTLEQLESELEFVLRQQERLQRSYAEDT